MFGLSLKEQNWSKFKLQNSFANVMCRVAANDQWSDWDVGLRHVILLKPESTDELSWEFKSRLITENAVENSDKFYVRVRFEIAARLTPMQNASVQ